MSALFQDSGGIDPLQQTMWRAEELVSAPALLKGTDLAIETTLVTGQPCSCESAPCEPCDRAPWTAATSADSAADLSPASMALKTRFTCVRIMERWLVLSCRLLSAWRTRLRAWGVFATNYLLICRNGCQPVIMRRSPRRVNRRCFAQPIVRSRHEPARCTGLDALGRHSSRA